MINYGTIIEISEWKESTMATEMKVVKKCMTESGKHHWLRTNVRWLRPGDFVRSVDDNGEVKKDVTYKVITKPYWSEAHKLWDVKMVMWEREDDVA